jgi:hypothetical protein
MIPCKWILHGVKNRHCCLTVVGNGANSMGAVAVIVDAVVFVVGANLVIL